MPPLTSGPCNWRPGLSRHSPAPGNNGGGGTRRSVAKRATTTFTLRSRYVRSEIDLVSPGRSKAPIFPRSSDADQRVAPRARGFSGDSVSRRQGVGAEILVPFRTEPDEPPILEIDFRNDAGRTSCCKSLATNCGSQLSTLPSVREIFAELGRHTDPLMH